MNTLPRISTTYRAASTAVINAGSSVGDRQHSVSSSANSPIHHDGPRITCLVGGGWTCLWTLLIEGLAAKGQISIGLLGLRCPKLQRAPPPTNHCCCTVGENDATCDNPVEDLLVAHGHSDITV